MPLVKPKNKEKKSDFVSRCIGDTTTNKDFPDQKQRIAVCYSQWEQSKKEASAHVEFENEEFLIFLESECLECDETIKASEEELTLENLYFPNEKEYLSAEEIDLEESEFVQFNIDEYFNIEVASAAEYQGRKVTLNKPFRTPDGPKKSAVYVKNKSGKVIIVRFGDKNMSIKKNIPARRKSFRARHKCDQAKDKTTPRYWACKSW
jgi:hypothetical protein